jgi:hypothetical protein
LHHLLSSYKNSWSMPLPPLALNVSQSVHVDGYLEIRITLVSPPYSFTFHCTKHNYVHERVITRARTCNAFIQIFIKYISDTNFTVNNLRLVYCFYSNSCTYISFNL